MSVDLKGNTNYTTLKDLEKNILVPRTNLSAIDLNVGLGIDVSGDTISIKGATTGDIEAGTPNRVVTAEVLKPVIDQMQGSLVAGEGIEIVAGTTTSTISTPLATVSETIKGTTATEHIDVKSLRGALTTGQAVDVTSVPDQTITGDYKGTFTTTATTLGFASFPKFASGLKYLMIADVTVTAARNITPSGTWLDGTSTAKALAANTATRVAMIFTTASTGKFTFSGSGTVTVANLREYEVTASTKESIEYIAALSSPDTFGDYYLIKSDMVQPWTTIINMGTAAATTIAAGLAYQINATTGSHIITVDTCPTGYVGKDAYVRLYVGATGNVVVQSPLRLATALVANAINNCKVEYRDGLATLTVTDILGGYVVTANGSDSTTDGTLAYGLVQGGTNYKYINFGAQTDGIPVELGGVTTANAEKLIVGNGYTETIIGGSVSCSSKTTFSNLTMSGVSVLGGTATLADVYIPTGATVSVSGGVLAVEKVTGDGGVIDLNGTNFDSRVSSGRMSGLVFSGASSSRAMFTNVGIVTDIQCYGCTFTGNEGGNAALAYITKGSMYLSGCTVQSNGTAAAIQLAGGVSTTVELENCFFGASNDIYLSPNSSACVILTGSNHLQNAIRTYNAHHRVTITDGAIVDLTGNANANCIMPDSSGAVISNGITFGSNVTIINSAGVSSLLNGGVAGSCGVIKKDGTIS